MTEYQDFNVLNGLTISSVDGLSIGSGSVTFNTSDGVFKLLHFQDCCESVSIADIVGDIADLNDALVINASEDSNADGDPPECPDSYTWTYYNIQTNKGHVQIRWLGESNGYYCETAFFIKDSK
jgi:hypothetical protein